MTELRYDDAATQRLLAAYLTPDIAAQRAHFLRVLAPAVGERILDVGAGPGFLARDIGAAVGPGGHVLGIDISAPLRAIAQAHCAGMPWIGQRAADAAALPPDLAPFDAVICTQVLEYLPDVDAALAGFYRALKPGGRVVIVDTDWDSIVWHATDAARMRRILTAWEAHAADVHLPRTLQTRLQEAGFAVAPPHVLPLLNTGADENTYSHRLIDLIQTYLAGRSSLPEADVAAWAEDLRDLLHRGAYFFSLNRYVFTATRAA